ncbi:DUF397 domain-containing protein [Streptomyces sp. M41]|uniref:DUF397 domain-containing protein n=1 Tax=Streptomyces sp. M41 TaxID=3059412 RepID=UPI00374D383D
MNTSDLAWFKSSYSGGSGDDCVEVALSWRKSTYSSGDGDDCVEVALPWHKSTHSSGGSGDCVEVAPCATAVHVRDTKDRQGPQFAVAPAAWADFVTFAAAAPTS